MPLSTAPYYHDICPDGTAAEAYWATAGDGKRIRVAVWGKTGTRGTVLLFPGRTEYVEKYAETASVLAERGFCTIAIDWRGQGLADRLLDDPMIGHVEKFIDYQKDIAALLEVANTLNLPKPHYLLTHSMGGAIGLRALIEGLDVNAAVFSAPMWGIQIAPHMRLPARIMGILMPKIGMGTKNPPGTTAESYVLTAGFEDNMLTTDPDMFKWMQDQVQAYPALRLGGPSYVWLRESLHETSALSKRLSPDVPTLTFLGTNERIVDPGAIRHRMNRWPNGKLVVVDGSEHEVLMEKPHMRQDALEQIAGFFAQHG